MRSAELQLERLDLPFDPASEATFADEAADGIDAAAALKREVAERLAAHRSRRGRQTEPQAHLIPLAHSLPEPQTARQQLRPTGPKATSAKPRTSAGKANRIAAAVAERYAQTPSYREFLAAEAARALEEANAKAEIAARNAEAVANAQQQLLADLDQWSDPEAEAAPFEAPGPYIETPTQNHAANPILQSIQEPVRYHVPAAELRIRHYADQGISPPTARAAMRVNHPSPSESQASDEELLALEDEIAFRQAPRFPPPASPPVPIPANLLEFPRQLVATRKARPRIAEGPLREDADSSNDAAQLRIFEVEPGQIATGPDSASAIAADPPVWSTIRLDASPSPIDAGDRYDRDADLGYHFELPTPFAEPAAQARLEAALPLATAPLDQRAMAAMVDGCVLGFTFLAIAAGFARFVPSLPPAPVAAIAAGATLLALFVLYQMLFFTFDCATPGMRYARISLCTFDDENPTRSEMRRRTWALLLSACPLGLGFLWALLDEDRLGWHDRISRMYQRGY